MRSSILRKKGPFRWTFSVRKQAMPRVASRAEQVSYATVSTSDWLRRWNLKRGCCVGYYVTVAGDSLMTGVDFKRLRQGK